MGVLGDNPHDVRQILKDAYDIRSSFAHGSHLSDKTRRKLENKYQEIKKILLKNGKFDKTSIPEALDLCKEMRGPVATTLMAGLVKSSYPKEEGAHSH